MSEGWGVDGNTGTIKAKAHQAGHITRLAAVSGFILIYVLLINIIISIAKTLSPWRGHNLRSSVISGAFKRRVYNSLSVHDCRTIKTTL